MKILSLTFLFALSIGNVFAKGGDFPPVDYEELAYRLKAYKQIQVAVEVTNNLNEYLESKEELGDFLTNLKTKYPISIKRVNGVHSTSFCIILDNSTFKNTVVNEVSEKLKLFPISVNTSLKSNLDDPCN